MNRKRTVARRVRFHCAWIAGTIMILDAVSSVWTAFDGMLPIPPIAYAGLGLVFALASGVGHLIINDN